MNQCDFEAKLKADGYTEIEKQDLAPRPGKGRQSVGPDGASVLVGRRFANPKPSAGFEFGLKAKK
jgi:hypothetical protein